MVATALHELAGAFVPESPVDEIVLVSGDSDFWPVLRRLLKHRPTLRVCVCATARQGSVQTAYLKWMGDESRARFVELRETLKLLGGDAKLNFENLARVPDAERPGCVRRFPLPCIIPPHYSTALHPRTTRLHYTPALLDRVRGQSSGRLPHCLSCSSHVQTESHFLLIAPCGEDRSCWLARGLGLAG
jgi:hypothetical protein